jgi:hypothetical protein
MKLQELIDQTDLDMTEAQVKAFFLGVLCAEKPMPFPKALDEILSETPEAKKELEADFKKLYEHLKTNLKAELEKMFPEESEINAFMEIAKDQLDYFLTAMSLSGTNTESCKDEDLAELIEELEDTVEDMDDFLSDSEATPEDGNDFKEFLIGTWADFSASKK